MDGYTIINSDCLKAMKDMPDGCIDAIVTDPPYGLAFMGAKWDSFNGSNGKQTTKERQDEGRRYAAENKGAPRYGNSHGKKVTRSEMVAFQEAMTPIFEEALRVSKAGAHMLCFGGTRTFHRLACSLEDAGWEIRDCIMWVYGSGFPKSMDVGKAIDKALGAKREQVRIPASEVRNPKVINSGHGIDGGDRPWMKKALEVGYHEKDGDIPATDQAKEWDGWGTCLKPAWEPIIVARKPLDGTVAHNVMTYGTGAINIDGCRVPIEQGDDVFAKNPHTHSKGKDSGIYGRYNEQHGNWSGDKGRFPANLVHDGSQMVLDLFPQTGRSSGGGNRTRGKAGHEQTGVYGRYIQHQHDGERGIYSAFAEGGETVTIGYDDDGSAARFFYCAKASKKDRGEGNDHPTVKPNALMRWLVRLVCPQGGTVLDPFMGSGSTGVACIQEGMRFVGIDMDEHYCEIAEKRIGAEPFTVFAEV